MPAIFSTGVEDVVAGWAASAAIPAGVQRLAVDARIAAIEADQSLAKEPCHAS
jgi:hypothetical protein